ncbi:MAG TPA: primosomal protein N' [Candidatus Kapabacteria bacterium]|nr:primosomal protein N' [Candidatus Kapabacteria bacterium]
MADFVQVALPVPLFKSFTYSVPEEWRDLDLVGMRVTAPFGRRTLTGIVVEELAETELKKVRAIIDLLDHAPLFTREMLRFAEWMSSYYLSPLGETLRSMMPQGMTPESSQRVMLAGPEVMEEISRIRRAAPRQAAILTALADHPRGVTLAFLQRKIGADSLHAQLAALEEKALIVRTTTHAKGTAARTARGVRISPELLADEERLRRLFDELDRLAPKQAAILLALSARAARNGNQLSIAADVLKESGASDSALKGLHGRGAVEIGEIAITREEVLLPEAIETEEESFGAIDGGSAIGRAIVPNAMQRNAIDTINTAIDTGEFKTFLLHGVTGSGKTQVYIEAIRHAVSRGRRALMLVPEITLTVQLVERFLGVFGDRVVVLHSRMSPGERFDGWRRAAEGTCDVVIGARSALFAPLRDLGVVVVDEEHEASYKQYDAQPRYNARDAAIVRAQLSGAVAVLGSATPSIESYFNVERGKYGLLELPERVDNAREPKIIIVDTVTARKQGLMRGALSVRLLKDIRERIERREGVILLQNRRGFATRLECMACSHSPMCPHCAVTLTYHKSREELHCHYCGYQRAVDRVCEICGNHDLRQPGVGTQKVEEELAAELAEARMLRMDQDTTSRKGAHRKMLAAFGNGEVDILLGTQMVAKGLDFSRVSLVGVISADTQLLLPDFRASERTYQLLTQVAGRAGRRSNVEGEVVIQTAHPHHPAIQASLAKNYAMLYNDELHSRRELNYPPFSRFILVEFRSEDQAESERHAQAFRKLLPASSPALDIMGPTAALISKLRNLYRYQIVIKNSKAADPAGRIFYAAFADALERYNTGESRPSVQLIVDVDAQGIG